jgi:hypothetical protein
MHICTGPRLHSVQMCGICTKWFVPVQMRVMNQYKWLFFLSGLIYSCFHTTDGGETNIVQYSSHT